MIDGLLDGAESHLEQFLRPECKPGPDRDQLQQHIEDPQPPENMQQIDPLKEVPTVQDLELLRPEENEQDTADEDKAARDQSAQIDLADPRARRFADSINTSLHIKCRSGFSIVCRHGSIVQLFTVFPLTHKGPVLYVCIFAQIRWVCNAALLHHSWNRRNEQSQRRWRRLFSFIVLSVRSIR